MHHNNHARPTVQFDMLALSRQQIALVRVMAPLAMGMIILLPSTLLLYCLPTGWLGLAPQTLGILLSTVLWLGCGFLLQALFRGAAMASAQQQQQLQQLFAAYPELQPYRDRVAALGRGFTVGEHETLMAWPAMKADMVDDLDSEA